MTVEEACTPTKLAELVEQTRQVLASSDRTTPLLSDLPDPEDHSPLRLAVAGPYSAGKTLLLAGLLNLPAEEIEKLVAAEPKTSSVTEYPTANYTLLDLPGTLAGLAAHDAEARRGVRRADLLLIVTTTELPGEAEAEQIRRLLDDDGFAGRSLVVVNKASAENSDSDVIRDEIRIRLGSVGSTTPVLFTDALDYKQSRLTPGLTDTERDLLLRDSGILQLVTAIDDLLQTSDDPRGQTQRRELSRVLEAAAIAWTATVEEEAEANTAARLQSAISACENDLTAQVTLILDKLHLSIHAAGESLGEEVSEKDGALAPKAQSRADAAVETAIDEATTESNAAIVAELDRLGTAFGTASKRHAEWSATFTRRPPVTVTDPLRERKVDKVFGTAWDKAQAETKKYLRGLAESGTAAGDRAHNLAKQVNNLRGKEAKANVHKNVAKKLTKGAAGAETVIDILGPLLDGSAVVNDALRRQRIKDRRREIASKYRDYADKVVQQEHTDLARHIKNELQAYHDAAAPIIGAARSREAERTAALERLAAIRAHVDVAVRLP